MACLCAYDCATIRRDEWYGVNLRPGTVVSVGVPENYKRTAAPDERKEG